MRFAFLAATMLFAPTAMAQDGIFVTIAVVDEAGEPIPSAVVRHPEEKERRRVNMETGEWRGNAVYLEDGTELLFEKNMELAFEVSAPGYQMQPIRYLVKKRKNRTEVSLKKLQLDLDMTDEEDAGPVIGFKHDKPRD